MSLSELRPFYKNEEQLSPKSATGASGAAAAETWREIRQIIIKELLCIRVIFTIKEQEAAQSLLP